jgi:hypothetical protein
MTNRKRVMTGGAAALIAGAISLSAVAPAMAAEPTQPLSGASPDTATAVSTTPTTLDVLANDVAPEGSALDASSLALLDEAGQPVQQLESELGSWAVVDGQLAFTPAAGAEGVAEAAYTVTTSSGVVATSTVSVEVQPAPAEEPAPEQPVEPAPVEPAPEEPVEELLEVEDDRLAHEFSEAAPEAVVDVLANDELGGAELDPSTLALTDEDGAPVQELETDEGTWTVVDGQLAFAAAEGFTGKATAEYTVETADGAVATGEVRVDATWAGAEPEVALADDSTETPRHEPATVDVLANDEIEGITLDAETLQLIGEDGQPTDEVTTWAGTWSIVDGEVRFDGHPRHKGETSIDYVVAAGDQTAGATLTVDVDQRPAAALR